jgi:hypothetical protein
MTMLMSNYQKSVWFRMILQFQLIFFIIFEPTTETIGAEIFFTLELKGATCFSTYGSVVIGV